MNIIYHCYGGTHSSVLAACLHLGILRNVWRPFALPGFDRRDGKDLGILFYYGRDHAGNRVYVLGRDGYPAAPLFVYRTLGTALGADTRCLFVDTTPCLNFYLRLGGFLSCRFGLKRLGRPLLAFGTRLAGPKLAALVAATRKVSG